MRRRRRGFGISWEENFSKPLAYLESTLRTRVNMPRGKVETRVKTIDARAIHAILRAEGFEL